MLFRTLYDDRLAQACYLIGCQRTGEAIVVDPPRDIDRVLELARREGLRIVAAAETHIHADYLSGLRELGERIDCLLLVSGAGAPDWTSRWLDARIGGGSYRHRVLLDGDEFRVGNIHFRALHTPGHTPEHLCYLVTDLGGGADAPMGIVTGDFVFVGDLGRPDLLESAAGEAGAKEPSARALLRSAGRFLDLPDFLQVWPGHGAGSACGKALGAVPQSTVGYERRFNRALRATADADSFVQFILEGQPEPPMYFARMKRDNRDGPRVLGSLPQPPQLTPEAYSGLDARRVAILDTRPWAAFGAAHTPGALFAPIDQTFPMVAGSYVAEDEPIVLVSAPQRVEEAVRLLVRIGLDRIEGWLDASMLEAARDAGARLVDTSEIDAAGAARMIESRHVAVVDVRRADEFAAGHLPGAIHAPYTRLPERLGDLPRDAHLLVNCRSGARSARAAAYLARQGYEVTNLAGGWLAWEQRRQPVET